MLKKFKKLIPWSSICYASGGNHCLGKKKSSDPIRPLEGATSPHCHCHICIDRPSTENGRRGRPITSRDVIL